VSFPKRRPTFGIKGAAMESNQDPPLDPQAFFADANGGTGLSTYKIHQIFFSQGEPADSIFYIREGKVKVAVLSE
jgi:CRP/FNR family transcriptional regulator, cyclic AMP receptor protein